MAANTTGVDRGPSPPNAADLPDYLRDLTPRRPAAKVLREPVPCPEVRVARDEILDGHSRIVGYRFRAVVAGGEGQPSARAKLDALKEDHLANFAQHRLAVVPIDDGEWRALDFRQFVTPNIVFHLALPNDAGAAWLGTLAEIRDCGAGVALDGAVAGSSLAEALELASIVFVRPADYAAGGLAKRIEDLRSRRPGIRIAADGVRSWREYRASLDMGVDYCLGEFAAIPYERDEALELAVVESVLSRKLVQFSWYRVFECGNEEIDRDHRALVALANELLNGIMAGKTAGQLAGTVDALVHGAVDHFVHEEAALKAVGYSRLAHHAALHRALLEKATRLVADFKAGRTEIGPVFQFLAEDLIVGHMLGADREFFPMFAVQDGAPASAAGAARTVG